MNNLPTAIVFEVQEHFGSGLVRALEKKGTVRVIVASSVDEIRRLREEPDFVFDLEMEPTLWEWAANRNCILSVISADFNKMTEEKKKVLEKNQGNWRYVVGNGIYGQFLLPAGNWIYEMFKSCVLNKAIPIPERERPMLYERDFWEAVSRITFLNTPKRRAFEIWGREVSPDKLSKILWQAGQMTVREAKFCGVDIETDWQEKRREIENLVRFEPKTELDEVIDVALQPYFEKIEQLKAEKNGIKIEEKKAKIEYEVLAEKNEEIVPEEKKKEKERTTYILPEIKINKRADKEEPEIDPFWQKLMEKKIESVSIPKPLPIKKEETIKKVSSKKKKNFSWIKNLLLVVVSGFLLALLFSGLWFFLNVRRLGNNIRDFPAKVAVGNWDDIEKNNQKDLAFLKKMENVVGSNDLLRVIEDVIYLEGQLQVVYTTSNEVALGVWGEKEVSWRTLIPAWQNTLLSADTSLARLEARLQGNLDWVPDRWLGQVRNLRNQLGEWRAKIKLGVEGLPVFTDLVGVDGERKTYLVLLQNEMELRPTGGFIGSYGILTFEGGKFVDFRVQDIYAADGQIQGYVEPPSAIKKYLVGPDAWKMRDSNWQPYFVAASKDIRWFYEKASGQKVDGVIALTLSSVEKVLGAIGEVQVPDYGARVNKDNLYEQAQFFAEKNFFPGSTQKQSFLSKLASGLFEELKTAKGQDREKIISSLLDSLVSRDIQMALNEQKSAGILAALGWDGSLVSGKCGEENCVADYLMLNEANLGVNKANYFIKRKISMIPKLVDNTLERTVNLELENTAKNSNWPAGDYKNYLRLYLPLDVEIEDILVQDPEKPNNQLRYTNQDYSMAKYGDKKELGFLVEVPVASKRIIKVIYKSKVKINPEVNFSYLLYWQRQSGYGKKTDIEFQFTPPGGRSVGQIYPAAEIKDGFVRIMEKFSKDIPIGIELLP